jgi:hypothetical protein
MNPGLIHVAAVAIALETGRLATGGLVALLRDCMEKGAEARLTPVRAVAMSAEGAEGPDVGAKVDGPDLSLELYAAPAGDQTLLTLFAPADAAPQRAMLISEDGSVIGQADFEPFGVGVKAEFTTPATGNVAIIVQR